MTTTTNSNILYRPITICVTEYMKLSSYSVGISDLIADNDTNNKISQAVSKKIDVSKLQNQLHVGVLKIILVKQMK